MISAHEEVCQWHEEVCQWHVEVCQWHEEVCQWHVEVCQWHVEVCQWHVEGWWYSPQIKVAATIELLNGVFENPVFIQYI
jgi:hypothetical protein